MKKYSLHLTLTLCALIAPVAAFAVSGADNFNRPDAATPGPNWTVIDGTVQIFTGRARAGTSPAAMTWTTPAQATVSVAADVFAPGGGPSYVGFILRYNSPADCIFVTVEDTNGDGTFDQISWYYGINGLKGFSDSAIVGTPISPTPNASIRVDAYGSSVSVAVNNSVTYFGTMPVATGAGVGLGFYGPAQADNFSFGDTAYAPVHTALYTKAEPVPTAGVNPQIAAGAVWTGFGVPAMNGPGTVAFIGKWSAPKNGATPAQSGIGVFRQNTLLLKVGSPVPGAGTGTLPLDAVIKSVKDPILSPNGSALIPVTIKGTGVTPQNDSAIIWSPQSNVNDAAVVVREGDLMFALGDSGAILAIKGVAVNDAGAVFTASLRVGSGAPAITTANDNVVLGWTPVGGLYYIAREGDELGHGILKSFKTLVGGPGAPGDGRSWANTDILPPAIGLLATYMDGAKSLVTTDGSTVSEVVTTGQPIGNPTGGTFKALGLPAWQFRVQNPVFLATEATGTKGLYTNLGGDSTQVVKLGDTISSGGPLTFNIKSLKDPVQDQFGNRAYCLGTLSGVSITPSNDLAVMQFEPYSSNRSIVAQERARPPDVPFPALWKSFTSVAARTVGPLILASLKQGFGGVTAANDVGVWGEFGFGVGGLRLFFREGDPIVGKTLKSFVALKAVSGSPGTTRCWNDNGLIVWRAIFTDGSTSIMQTQAPQPPN